MTDEKRVRDVFLAFWTKPTAAERVQAIAAEHHKNNRSEALREIMRQGLAAYKPPPAPSKETPK